MTADEHPVVLYDGVCGLCNRLVRMILRRDPAALFRFAPLQGQFARAALARHGLGGPGAMDTMYVVVAPATPAERLLSRSGAAIYIWSRVRGPLRVLRGMRWLPHSLRDALYGLVARWRYRWFGKYESCPVPPPQWKDRFIE